MGNTDSSPAASATHSSGGAPASAAAQSSGRRQVRPPQVQARPQQGRRGQGGVPVSAGEALGVIGSWVGWIGWVVRDQAGLGGRVFSSRDEMPCGGG